MRLSEAEYAALVGRQRPGRNAPAAPRRTEEADFQKAVIELAEMFGWLTHHETDSRWTRPGWPDLVLARPGHHVIVAELKSSKGKLTIAQRAWIETLQRTTGLSAYVWRPSDLDEIAKILKP